jgi:hypothetical protein
MKFSITYLALLHSRYQGFLNHDIPRPPYFLGTASIQAQQQSLGPRPHDVSHVVPIVSPVVTKMGWISDNALFRSVFGLVVRRKMIQKWLMRYLFFFVEVIFCR